MLNKLLCIFIGHRWKTTCVNQWGHSTAQKCRCGLKREFEYDLSAKEGMPWEKGLWRWSDGRSSKYSVKIW